MDWGMRLKAAWHGEVPDADLKAMFAATESLTRLQQALEDRRLAAKLDYTGYAWRGVLAVGRIAAPLWLADALVSLAGTFYDGEKQSQPKGSELVSPYIHDLVVALLGPVEDIIADVAAALANPDHRTALTAPLHIGPGGQIAQGALPEPISTLYARSIAAGARRAHTGAAVALASTQAEVATSPAPDWLAAGLRRLSGDLDAAGARLDMAEVRLAPLVALAGEHGGDPVALTALCRELWTLADSAIVVGQAASDPHLLREAPRGSLPMQAAQAATPVRYSSPVPQPQWQPPAPLPRIAEGAPSLPMQHDDASPSEKERASAAPSHGSALPTIGEGGAGAGVSSVTREPAANIPLPSVSDPSHPQEAGAAPPAEAHQESQEAPHAHGTATNEAEHDKDDAPAVRFPDIG